MPHFCTFKPPYSLKCAKGPQMNLDSQVHSLKGVWGKNGACLSILVILLILDRL